MTRTTSNFDDYLKHEFGAFKFHVNHELNQDTLVYMLDASMAESNEIRNASAARCFQMMLDERSVNGKVWVEVDSTDCDLYQATSLHQVPATLAGYREFKDHVYDNAEGPTYFRVLHPEDVDHWQRRAVDHAAEQMGY